MKFDQVPLPARVVGLSCNAGALPRTTRGMQWRRLGGAVRADRTDRLIGSYSATEHTCTINIGEFHV